MYTTQKTWEENNSFALSLSKLFTLQNIKSKFPSSLFAKRVMGAICSQRSSQKKEQEQISLINLF